MTQIKINETSRPFQKAFSKGGKILTNGSVDRVFNKDYGKYVETVINQNGSFSKEIWISDIFTKQVIKKVFDLGSILKVQNVSSETGKEIWRFCKTLVSIN